MKRTRLAALALTAPLALALVACGDDDTEPTSDSPPSSDATSTDAPTDEATTTAPDDSASADGGATSTSPAAPSSSEAPTSDGSSAPAGDALLAAAATGADAIDGATVFSVDRQGTGGWEVTVVTDAGAEYDVRVSADGGSVEGKPVEDRDDGDDATRDRDERLRLLDAAGLDYRAAIDAAASSGGTEVTGVDLDEERGTATWEVTYDDDTPDEVTVYVDAGSGDVLGTERDD